MKTKNQIYIVLPLLLITIFISSCKRTYPTFAPIENIRLGMTEEESNIQAEICEKNNSIQDGYFITIEGIKAKMYFEYCASPIFKEVTLEGIVLLPVDGDIDRLYAVLEKKLDPKTKSSLHYEKHMMNSGLIYSNNTKICLYTNKIRYSKLGALPCKKPWWVRILESTFDREFG